MIFLNFRLPRPQANMEKARLTNFNQNKSDGQTNIDKCRVTALLFLKKQNIILKYEENLTLTLKHFSKVIKL